MPCGPIGSRCFDVWHGRITSSADECEARAILVRHPRAIAASAAGLVAIAAAAVSGAAFVSHGQAGASMAMAILTGVALLCYLANLYTIGGYSIVKT